MTSRTHAEAAHHHAPAVALLVAERLVVGRPGGGWEALERLVVTGLLTAPGRCFVKLGTRPAANLVDAARKLIDRHFHGPYVVLTSEADWDYWQVATRLGDCWAGVFCTPALNELEHTTVVFQPTAGVVRLALDPPALETPRNAQGHAGVCVIR
jgi:hypothetical protein